MAEKTKLSALVGRNYKALILAALIGSFGAASVLVDFVAEHEGEVLTTYKDPVGVWTACYGDTSPEMAVPGAVYSREECLESLLTQLINHARPVVEIIPEVRRSPKMAAAFASLTYNIGPAAFRSSSVVKRFKAGDYAGACEAMKMWNKAGGKVLKGLVTRRDDEYRLCMQGVTDMEKDDAQTLFDLEPETLVCSRSDSGRPFGDAHMVGM